MRFDGSLVGLKRFRLAWAAALALPVAIGFAAPTAATPTFSETETRNAPPGLYISADADGTFDNAGTNPRITAADFSTTEYYSVHRISDGRLWVQPMTAEELNALSSPPPSPITVDVTVTMTNDEGETASGTITFSTLYERDTSAQPGEPMAPVFSETETRNAPPGLYISADADGTFDNAGTNPRITAADFSTTEYYSVHQITEGRLFVQPMTAEELNALASPPPSPFTVEVTVTMTNDEGQTASGTITFQTVYEREISTPSQPIEPEAATPTFSVTAIYSARPGYLLNIPADNLFDNAGTNPKITDAVFSNTEYYRTHSVFRDRLWVEANTAEELNALSSPPPSPFTVDVTVTMANDENQKASGTITFETTYERDTPEQPGEASSPTFSQTETRNAPPGALVSGFAENLFDNAGTNPRITDAVFSTTEYYSVHSVSRGLVWVQAKTDAELNALASPPPDPFTVDITVTMANDEGQTASGTITFETTYERDEPTGSPPVFRSEVWRLPPGQTNYRYARWSFDNAGTNAKFTDVSVSTMEYYDDVKINSAGAIQVTIKSDEELNALSSPPPPNPIRVSADVAMTNDEGHRVTGTVTFETEYDRVEPPQPSEPEAATPTFSVTETRNAPPGVQVYASATEAFDNAGTNPRITGADFSATKYYGIHGVLGGILAVQAKTSEQLNALSSPPPSPFTVDVTVTMTNDEGQTASGTITFSTAYERDTSALLPAPVPPLFRAAAAPNFEGLAMSCARSRCIKVAGAVLANADVRGDEG